jgi:hypothetical protein
MVVALVYAMLPIECVLTLVVLVRSGMLPTAPGK